MNEIRCIYWKHDIFKTITSNLNNYPKVVFSYNGINSIGMIKTAGSYAKSYSIEGNGNTDSSIHTLLSNPIDMTSIKLIRITGELYTDAENPTAITAKTYYKVSSSAPSTPVSGTPYSYSGWYLALSDKNMNGYNDIQYRKQYSVVLDVSGVNSRVNIYNGVYHGAEFKYNTVYNKITMIEFIQ